jgi:FKBP-type peptidyl-prolyl cis-trans isomerase 2
MKAIAAFLLLLMLIGCAKVDAGDTVAVTYTGRWANGTIFDSNDPAQGFAEKPLVVTVGSGKVIKGFEDALIGMKEGEEKTLFIKSADAYGSYDAQKVYQIPKRFRFPLAVEWPRVSAVEKRSLPRELKVGETIETEHFTYNVTGTNSTHVVLYLLRAESPVQLAGAEWESRLVEVTAENFVFEHILKDGDVLMRSGVPYAVEIKNGTVVLTSTFEVGDIIPTAAGDGRIIRETTDNLYLDLNHPLAGNTLQFTIRVDEIR